MKKNILIILSLIIFFTVLGNILSNTYFFKHLELLSYDLRSKFNTDNSLMGKNLHQADKDIVIVAIDNDSFKALTHTSNQKPGSQWWEKDVWENVLNYIEKGKPKAVMFNMVFEEAEDKPWYDISFAKTLKKYDNTVLGTYLDNPILKENNFSKRIELENNDYIPTEITLDVVVDDEKLDKAITYTTNAPIDNIYTRNNIMGVLNSVVDDDSVVRKNQPIYKLIKGDKIYYMPSLAFAGFLKYMGSEGKIKIIKNKIYYKDRVIPIDKNGVVNISWHKMGRSYLYIPISDIILKKVKSEFFKDKLVIIGKTATGKNLNLDSIIDPSFTGPESSAVALDNFMNDTNPKDKSARKFVSEIPKPVQSFIIIVLCIIVALLGLIPRNAFMGFLNGFLSIIAYITFSFWLFIHPSSRIWLPVVEPLYYLAVTSGVVFGFRFYSEMTKKASIMNVFGKFVSPKVLATVLKDPNKLVLKNTKKNITILFCDVKDFSSISEIYNPEEIVTNLNELFREVVNIIFENNGTVDKFIGDCIMAYWGDLSQSEDDAYLAVKTALEIKKRVNELKLKHEKENKIVFDVKIGINTGEAILGLTGTEKIMNYTAMGDAVNTAARLETACSKLNRDILISKSTFEQSNGKIKAIEIGTIQVKGKKQKIEVYEPTDLIETGIESETKKELTATKK